MNCRRAFTLAVLVILTGVLPGFAQEEGAERESGFTRWEWAQDLKLPEKAPARYHAFLVPPEVFGRAQSSLEQECEPRRIGWAIENDEKRIALDADLLAFREAG